MKEVADRDPKPLRVVERAQDCIRRLVADLGVPRPEGRQGRRQAIVKPYTSTGVQRSVLTDLSPI